MVPAAAPYAESALSLAQLLAGPTARAADQAAAAEPPPGPRQRWLWPYVAALLIATTAIAVTADASTLTDEPLLATLLVASVLALDLVRIDAFERWHLSPAAVPALALAFHFGPLGPLAAELVIAVGRLVRGHPAVRWAFDLGTQGLAWGAAAGVFALLGPKSDALRAGAGVAGGLSAYAVSAALFCGALWIAHGLDPRRVLTQQLGWLGPHYVAFGALAGALVIVELHTGAWALVIFALPVVMLWVGQEQYLRRSRKLLAGIHLSYLQSITTLGRIVQARDPESAGRTERLARLARIIATELGFGPAELHAVTVGVLVHDLGKVGLSDSDDPRRVPELSARILDPLDLPPVVKDMARHHLERCDGSGVPDGLAGEAIPLAARILAVADALDQATTATAARPPLPLGAALGVLRSQVGTRLCPRAVGALEACLQRDPELRRYFGSQEPLAMPSLAV
jgi:hypothetical protein